MRSPELPVANNAWNDDAKAVVPDPAAPGSTNRPSQPQSQPQSWSLASSNDAPMTDAARVLNSFRAIVRASRTSTRALEMRFGTSAAQLFMLRALAGGQVGSVKELAQRTNTHNSSASVVVRRLCERGFVKRTASPDDRRRVGYAITADGVTYLASAPRVVDDMLLDGLQGMSRNEQARLTELLCRLIAHSEIPMCDGVLRGDDDAPRQIDAPHHVDAAD